jgi:hypothetical protein
LPAEIQAGSWAHNMVALCFFEMGKHVKVREPRS